MILDPTLGIIASLGPIPPGLDRVEKLEGVMKKKTRHKKSHKWRKKADSSPVAKCRRPKLNGIRNPRKRKHLGGVGL